MKKFFFSLFLIVPLLFGLFPVSQVSAAEGDVGYFVQAKIPTNQIDKKQTYFDLKMKPKQKQTVEIDVKNNSNEEIQVEASVNYASTNRTGTIDYTKNDTSEQDESLKYSLPQIAKIADDQKLLTIPVNGTETVQVTIEMPKDTVDGVVLGAVQFKKKATEGTRKAKGVSIKNEYSYVVGMQLTETDKQVLPNINLISIKPSLVNYRTAIVAKLQNDQPVIINGLSIDAKIYEQDSTKVLHQTKKSNMTMAPNSSFDFAIDWENKPLEKGEYRLKMTATDGENTWKWDQKFTIDEKGQDLNKEAVNIEKSNMWLYVGIAAGIFLGLVVIILIIVRRRKKR
ncbi:DUF916 and DUF3324 domain-containing protein [Listeria ivanovii]|uniref:DUF916 and DUF3324 domain-containing protein n=1 Tax=Listeria ivanovii TaxID=1638 RepID=UPI001909614B|nr:DUF916 and DUF3324 domain-containing protein [Listeria ivanovii]MBK3913627.1 DUF916 and DUF3324 domain-containing protein [Listeria ivanovii subsp. ivanovii]MBK3920255.1 DUF916 and DUF3324 domain-containing protein [Listeria ivanovii subsp. ivanovii]MBK3925917.1 DUF916 and DUF3324 domain-containing protein [Listeria ivanovii subsp. ivanovii]